MTILGLDISQLPWAAGIADGEGSFLVTTSVDKRRLTIGNLKTYSYPRPRFTVSQSGKNGIPQMLTRMKSLFGGFIRGPYDGGGKRAPIYQWCLHGHERVQWAMAAIWPWLGDVKREQAIHCLTEYRKRSPMNKPSKCPHCELVARPGPLATHIRWKHK